MKRKYWKIAAVLPLILLFQGCFMPFGEYHFEMEFAMAVGVTYTIFTLRNRTNHAWEFGGPMLLWGYLTCLTCNRVWPSKLVFTMLLIGALRTDASEVTTNALIDSQKAIIKINSNGTFKTDKLNLESWTIQPGDSIVIKIKAKGNGGFEVGDRLALGFATNPAVSADSEEGFLGFIENLKASARRFFGNPNTPVIPLKPVPEGSH